MRLLFFISFLSIVNLVSAQLKPISQNSALHFSGVLKIDTSSGFLGKNFRTRLVKDYKIKVLKYVRTKNLTYIELSKSFESILTLEDPGTEDEMKLVLYKGEVYQIRHKIEYATFKSTYLENDSLYKIIKSSSFQNLPAVEIALLFDAAEPMLCKTFDSMSRIQQGLFLGKSINPTFCLEKDMYFKKAGYDKVKVFRSARDNGRYQIIYYFSGKFLIIGFKGFVVYSTKIVEFDFKLKKVS